MDLELANLSPAEESVPRKITVDSYDTRYIPVYPYSVTEGAGQPLTLGCATVVCP